VKCYLQTADCIVAADSGLDLAYKLHVEPDLVVGDMDSLSDKSLLNQFSAERKRIFPPDKDETDTEIGLKCLRERGVDRPIIVGGGEGRLDHLMGILSLFEREYSPRIWITAREHVELIDGKSSFESIPGQLFSFFPIGERADGLGSRGLKWRLTGLSWKRGDIGISNEATGSRVDVWLTNGKILMVRPLSG
jgi:thiamine pyrophosphokinase